MRSPQAGRRRCSAWSRSAARSRSPPDPGTARGPWTEEEPGRMVHEMRRGPLAMLGITPTSRVLRVTDHRLDVPARAERAVALDRRRRPAAATSRCGDAHDRVGGDVRRSGPGWLPRIPAAVAGRPEEPGLEGLGRGDPLPGRSDRGEPHLDARGAGVPLHGAPAHGGSAGGTRRAGRSRRRAVASGVELRAAWHDAFWMPRRGVLRARARSGRAAGRDDRLECRSCAGRRDRAA